MIFHLRNKTPKELLHEPISKFFFDEFWIWSEVVRYSNIFSKIKWVKELTSCRTFQIFLFLEQIIEYNNCRNLIFQGIFIKSWQGAVISQLRNKWPKQVLHEPILKLQLMNLKFEMKLYDPAISFHRWGGSMSFLLAKPFKYSCYWNR